MNKKLSLYWVSVLLLLLLPLVSIGDNLGLYYDAILPDYAATQILNPQEYQVRFFVVYPFLAQVYHGTVSMWISSMAILITGTTSVLQHHIVNVLVIYINLLLLDKIFENNKVNIWLRRSSILIFSIMPTLMSFTMTQYYIELPGMLFLLAAVILYEKAENNGRNADVYFFFAFFMLGLAFYSYFNYLFFVPGFILLYAFKRELKHDRIKKTIIGCYGTVSGAALYFTGGGVYIPK